MYPRYHRCILDITDVSLISQMYPRWHRCILEITDYPKYHDISKTAQMYPIFIRYILDNKDQSKIYPRCQIEDQRYIMNILNIHKSVFSDWFVGLFDMI